MYQQRRAAAFCTPFAIAILQGFYSKAAFFFKLKITE
jgi:hypothetical protein